MADRLRFDKALLLVLLKQHGTMTAKACDPCYAALEELREDFLVTRFGPCKDGTCAYQITEEGREALATAPRDVEVPSQ